MPPHLIPPIGHLFFRVRLLVDEWGRPDLLLKILYMVLTARLPGLILLTQQHLRLVLFWILQGRLPLLYNASSVLAGL